MPSIKLNSILNRLAVCAGAKTDADLARSLGVSPQTLATWKNRGKIPYEQICEFANEHFYSLDYLIMGSGFPPQHRREIDEILFENISNELSKSHEALNTEVRYKLSINELCIYTAKIYNRIINKLEFTDDVEQLKNQMTSLIKEEITYLLDIKVRAERGGDD